jgi:hypothetical protein
MTDEELLSGIDAYTLPPEAFTHTEHVRLAWICLRKHSLLVAMAEFRRLLTGFANHAGKPCLYHETITFAYLLLVYERMTQSPPDMTWSAFAAAHPDLLSWKDGPFFRLYDKAVLNDRMARFCFVLPPSETAEARRA